jgi:HD-GYP domain-containing protein (c-di-GMP phosphodiesterase class II)
MEEKLLEKVCEYLEKVSNQNLDAADIDYLSKVVDIYKDIKEVENMNNYGNYGEYGRYDAYGRRGVDARYRGESYMDGMASSYRNYEEARNEYNRGNYGAKEDGLKELEYMMHAAMKFIKMVKEEATSPEEQEIVRKHIMKISEM